MSKIITTDYGEYKTPGFWTTTGGVLAGSCVASAVNAPFKKMQLPLINKLKKESQSINNMVLRQSIADAFEASGLKQKGVEIIDASNEKIIPVFAKNSKKDINGGGALKAAIEKSLPKWLRNSIYGKKFSNIIHNTIVNGNNAAFIPKSNKVAVNIKELGFSTFHEMGHAINHHSSKLWKSAQKCRQPLMPVAGIMSLTALFKRPKAEGEEPKNKFDKAATFIKNNVGKLVTLCFVPVIAEELKASQRGNKMASKFLPKDLAHKIKVCNRYAACTYIGSALFMGLSAYAATKVRDKIAHPKEV